MSDGVLVSRDDGSAGDHSRNLDGAQSALTPMTMRDNGAHVAQTVTITPGEPVDLGWAVGLLVEGVFTRTCKGCGASVSSPVDDAGNVRPARVHHDDACPELAKLRAL